MDYEDNRNNPLQEEISQNINIKRSSERYEDNERSSSEAKRSRLEVAASGSSYSQAAPCDMMMNENVPTFNQFGISTGVSNKSSKVLREVGFWTLPLPLPTWLDACEQQAILSVRPFSEYYGKGLPIYSFPLMSLANCCICHKLLLNSVGIVCETNIQHVYCPNCTRMQILHKLELNMKRYDYERLPFSCPSGQKCLGRDSAIPWSIDESLRKLINDLANLAQKLKY